MKELVPLLEKLAAKLGTTVEMLWSVLLKQAPISSATNLLVCVVLIWFVVWSFRFVQKKTTAPLKSEENKYPAADWREEGALVAWLAVTVISLFILAWIGLSAENIVAGFFNPQYWALEQILSKCR